MKEPAERFQTAAEVAELLEQHLVHLDDPAPSSPSGELVGGDITNQPPESPRSEAVPAPTRRARRKWAVASAVLLLGGLALTLTELAGVTHWFRGGATRNAAREQQTESPSTVAKPKTPLVPEPEKPATKETATTPRAPDEHPLKKTQVGDWVRYRITEESPGRKVDGTMTLEVAGRTATRAKIKTITTIDGRSTASPEADIDLSKPYDPTQINVIPRRKDAQIEKLDSGKEKLKLGAREYETSWARWKVTEKSNGIDQEETSKYWTSPDGPFGGMVKIEAIILLKQAAGNAIVKITVELMGSGRRLFPTEARRLAARGDWKAAAAEYARIFAAQPLEDGEQGFECATVLLLSGDEAGYRKFCAEFVTRSGQPGIRPYHVARACTLAPDSVKDSALPARLAKAELQNNRWEFWSLTEQGALAYRAGRSDQAESRLQA